MKWLDKVWIVGLMTAWTALMLYLGWDLRIMAVHHRPEELRRYDGKCEDGLPPVITNKATDLAVNCMPDRFTTTQKVTP